MSWPNLETLVSDRLSSVLGVAAGPETPADLSLYLRVTVASGDDDSLNDRTLVDVEAFAPTRDGATNLAEDARMVMLGMAATNNGGGLVDTVTTALRPRWVDYRNPDVERVVSAYRIVCRPL